MRRIPDMLMGIAVLAAVALAGHDMDIRVVGIGGTIDAGGEESFQGARGLTARYVGSIPFNEKVSLLISEEIDAIASASPSVSTVPELNYPYNAVTGLGLAYEGPVNLRVKDYAHLMNSSQPIGFPVDYRTSSPHFTAAMRQKFRNGIEGHLRVPVNRFDGQATLLYSYLLYDYYPSDALQDTLRNQHDGDLWFNGALSYSFFEDRLALVARGLIKEDMNEYDGYDLYHACAGAEGSLKLLKKRLTLSGNLLARYYMSDIMDLKGYADEFGLISHLRGVYKITPTRLLKRLNFLRIFIKGDAGIELSPVITKQRYDVGLRAVTKKLSAVEAGYWLSGGGLFPRRCVYVEGDIAAIPKLVISPGVSAYHHWVDSTESYLFYEHRYTLHLRYDINSEKRRFFEKASLYTGAQFRWLFDLPFYVSALRIYFGITNWL